MHEIKCPNCGETFKVDESNYAAILSQIRTQEFDDEVHKKIESELKHQEEKLSAELELKLSKKESEISDLQAKLANSSNAQKLAISEATNPLEKERDNLKAQLEQFDERHKTELKIQEERFKNELNSKLTEKDSIIQDLKSKIELSTTDKELEIQKAVTSISKERDELKNELKVKDIEAQNKAQSLEEKYKGALQLRDEEIERLKDMKLKLSTKMVGETLEQHCEIEFNKLRATGFKNAYFEKDNKVSDTGSKGDYIFRETDENGTEIVSIMFEMKNENDKTSSKHKNEDFLKELDKDRREKNCEYAVLVSLLEADNELYNTGIVDVSHRYEKMYVIRPQFFIPMITLLRNAALNSMQYKNELAVIRNQDIDVTNFEKDMNEWKASWATTMKNAGKKHLEAIEQINKAIKDLEKTRDALLMSDKHLESAEGKLENLTIKRLTKNNPTMAEKFKNLEK